MNVDDTKEDLYFEGFNPSDLQKILERQKKVIEYQKKINKSSYSVYALSSTTIATIQNLLDILICYTDYLRGGDIRRLVVFYHYKSIHLLPQLLD